MIIEFPTKSNDDSTLLFSNNLGLFEYENGNEFAFDIFNSVINLVTIGKDFMKCRIFQGDQTTAMPVKIVCG